MNNALKVFHALRTFDRRATRLELERETGLEYDQVHEALRTLSRLGIMQKPDCLERQRGTYALIAGAQEPQTARGKYERTDIHRQRIAALVRARRAGNASPFYSPAAPPSHANDPGVLRTIIKGVLDVRHQAVGPFAACTLAKIWK